MGDGIESKCRPWRFEGRKAVGRPSYYQWGSIDWRPLIFIMPLCTFAFVLWSDSMSIMLVSIELSRLNYVELCVTTLVLLILTALVFLILTAYEFLISNAPVLLNSTASLFLISTASVFLISIASVFLISTAFGLIITLVIRSRSFDWPWAKHRDVFLMSLTLASFLLYGIVTVRYSIPEVVFRYKMWKLLDRFLGSERALALSDHVREVMPSRAACNPFLTDAVVSSTQESQFIARSLDFAPSMGQIRVQEIHEIKGIPLEEPRACSYSFQIGSGQIRVDAFAKNRNNFKFESRARGRLLEEFVTITDWDRIATIFSILRYWEKSPDLGVIENLYVVNGDGIYCHCLSLQSIVEGVCKSREQFSLFKLSASRRFYVGSVPQENKKEDKNSVSFLQKLPPFVLTVLGSVNFYFEVESKVSNAIAIVGLCIGILFACFMFIDGLISDFPFKLFVHWVLVCFFRKEDWRCGFYRWLKRKDCFLAFCDDFNPVLHRADEESELITLWNCSPGTSLAAPVHEFDWKEIRISSRPSSQWQWERSRFVYSTVLPTTSLSTTVQSWFKHGHEASSEDFEWHQGQRRYFELTLSGRTVRAASECHLNDDEAGGSENVFWYTQLQFDDDAVERLKWKESSYLLFVYLMVKWKTRKFGVISGFRKFWYAQYYHVFSTYELARHIRDNEEEDPNMPYSYHILTDHPKRTDMVAGYMHCKDVSIAGS
ncbi:hypothetical protein BDL97_16G073100 [Sphagnum fallax]|nr:hypothetical protein BDL97_16G073100 [Sphagnum fallax]